MARYYPRYVPRLTPMTDLLDFAKAVVDPDAEGRTVTEDYFKVLDGHLAANDNTDEPRIMFFPEPWDPDQWTSNPTRSRPPAAYGIQWPLPEEKEA